MIEETPAFARYADQLQATIEGERVHLENEFSGASYRVINFVADLPVKVDEHLLRRLVDPSADLGSIIFVLTEFQIMDAETARTNEEGENSHQAYKDRQYERVKARLEQGLKWEARETSGPHLAPPAASPSSPSIEEDDEEDE
jgi:uncharacterized protein (TIGR04552 family)